MPTGRGGFEAYPSLRGHGRLRSYRPLASGDVHWARARARAGGGGLPYRGRDAALQHAARGEA